MVTPPINRVLKTSLISYEGRSLGDLWAIIIIISNFACAMKYDHTSPDD